MNQGEAARLQKEVLEKARRIFGEERVYTIWAVGNLENMLQRQLDEAVRMIEEVLEKYKRIFGEDDSSTICSLANRLGEQGQSEEAAKMKKEVLEK